MPSLIIRKLKDKAFTSLRVAANIPVKYQYKDFSILLPPNHKLPSYQRYHPKYDKFLPHLSKHIDPSATVIDVGANVGDTLAGMVEHNSASIYICVEPDDIFFEYLTQNIARIKKTKGHLQVHPVKSLVGKSLFDVSLEGQGGTKHAVIGKRGTIQPKPLDEILGGLPNISNVRILKTDVDGFDYDVIDSSLAVIRDHKPIIFFECQYEFDYQKTGYEKTLLALEKEGYDDWTIFDNFGEVMVRTNDLKIITRLLDYVWRQNEGNSTRTIYYYDVLAAQGMDKDLIDRVLANYQ